MNEKDPSRKMEPVAKLAGGIAHDFNNLLMAIGSYCEVIRLKLGDESPVEQELESIRLAVQYGEELTRQLLAFGQNQVLMPTVLDPNQLISYLEEDLSRMMGDGIDVVLDLDPDIWHITVDAEQFHRVLRNMAANAREAMPGGGTLVLKTQNAILNEAFVSAHPGARTGEFVAISISDTGSGMNEATLAKLFEPFFSTKSQASGLGLSAVYGIVNQSGGTITVDSRPGSGSTFDMYLPRAVDQKQQTAKQAPLEPRKDITILLVDDNESVRLATCAFLTMKGYRILEAQDGRSALELARKLMGRIDLLITDMVMPVMGGEELAKALRQELPDIRILFMSGYSEKAIAHGGNLPPGTAFLQKPCSMKSVLDKMSELLEQ